MVVHCTTQTNNDPCLFCLLACIDLWEQGAEHVTMIQRSPSMVVSTTSVVTHGLGSLYRQDAPLHHEDADLVATSVPYKLMIPRWQAATKLMKENGAEERTDGWMAAFPIYL